MVLSRLLRVRHERPARRAGAKAHDELPPLHGAPLWPQAERSRWRVSYTSATGGVISLT